MWQCSKLISNPYSILVLRMNIDYQVATTRLESRLHRPNMEGCRDAAQKRLVQEVHEIDETIESLTNQLRNMENQLQALLVSEKLINSHSWILFK